MKEKTDLRLKNAENISKETLIDRIKTIDSTRFDQMLIENEERKTYFYVKYSSISYNRVPKILKFPLFKELVNDFERNIKNNGEIIVLENDSIIEKVKSKGKLPIDNPKYIGKNLVFSELKIATENNTIKLNQPLYYIPNDTNRCTCNTCEGDMYNTCTEHECSGKHIYDCSKCRTTGKLDCDDCNAQGQYTCPSCNGRGALKCSFCSGSGRDKQSDSIHAKCKQCNGSGERKCSSVNYGKGSGILGAATSGMSAVVKKAAGNEYCGGSGIIKCKKCSSSGKITCDKCEGDGKIECKTCYGDHQDNRYGKVDCETCETAGELASISYIETEIKVDATELIYTDGSIIEFPNFGVQTIKKHVDSSTQAELTYKNLNSENIENYNEFSSLASIKAMNKVNVSKDKYPKLLTEELYFEGVPCATINYNHILSATYHDVSVISIDKDKEVCFHSNPTSVAEEQESFKNKFNELWKKAFTTKTYKDKIDRKHEMFLMVHMAKADGIIEESEKKILAQTITGLHGFTNKEKGELFGLMSSNSLPKISPLNAYFSSKERANEAKSKIVNLIAKADGEYESSEKVKLNEITTAIEEGFKEKPSKIGKFFKTWQISFSIIILLIGLLFTIVYFILLKPISDAKYLHLQNFEKEKILTEFIEWTKKDTINNIDFTFFIMDLNSNELQNSFDKKLLSEIENSMLTPTELIASINHNSELEIENSKLSYTVFWTNEKVELSKKISDLTIVLNKRSGNNKNSNNSGETEDNNQVEEIDNSVQNAEVLDNTENEGMAKAYSTYTAIVKKAYFYSEPNVDSKLKSFIVSGQEVIDTGEEFDENEEFIYTNFEYKGKVTNGWLKKSDLTEKSKSSNKEVITEILTLFDNFDADGSPVLVFKNFKGESIQIESFDNKIIDLYMSPNEYEILYVKQEFMKMKFKVTYKVKQIITAESSENGYPEGFSGYHLLAMELIE